MIVYLDIIFLENLVLNIIILCATLIILRKKIVILRLILSGVIGSVYTIFYYVFPGSIFSSIYLKISLSFFMIIVLFKMKKFIDCILGIIVFYLISFVFGGISFLLLSKNYNLIVLITGFIITFMLIVIAFKLLKQKISKNNFICDAKISIGNREIRTKAMIDTGNLLKDPITNLPVVIVEKEILYDVLPSSILDNIENILGGDFENVPDEIKTKYMSKLKIIPFSSLGKQNGILLGIRISGLVVERNEEINKFNNVIMGIYDKKLSQKREFNALLGINTI